MLLIFIKLIVLGPEGNYTNEQILNRRINKMPDVTVYTVYIKNSGYIYAKSDRFSGYSAKKE